MVLMKEYFFPVTYWSVNDCKIDYNHDFSYGWLGGDINNGMYILNYLLRTIFFQGTFHDWLCGCLNDDWLCPCLTDDCNGRSDFREEGGGTYQTPKCAPHKVENWRRQRGGAGDDYANSAAELFLNFAEDQLVPDTVVPNDTPAREEKYSDEVINIDFLHSEVIVSLDKS